MPRVSVITPCYNCELFIEKAIQSVQEQTFTDWEHIIVNDGSKDRSKDVIESHTTCSEQVRLINQLNSGVARARNVGYENISQDSEYLLFLDGDDFLKPEMLFLMASYLDCHPDLGFVYCDRTCTDSKGNPIETHQFARYAPSRWGIREIPPDEVETPFSAVFNLAPVIPSVSLIRRSVYEESGGWDENFGQHYEDTNLFLNLAIRSKVHYLNQSLVYYRRHDSQSTANDSKFTAQEEKLYQLWINRKDLSLSQRQLIDQAWEFKTGKLAACLGLRSGNDLLKRGKFLRAMRFYAGAARRYFKSFSYETILN